MRCATRLLRPLSSDGQTGFSLIEVMIAVLVLAVGLLGASSMQLSALRYTDSARYRSQASFIAYDILDRIRANAGNAKNYEITALSDISSTGTVEGIDLGDLKDNVEILPEGDASIAVDKDSVVTVKVTWSEGRAEKSSSSSTSFSITSRVK